MVVSQNTKQFRRKLLSMQIDRSDFSYTLYDALGRIKEVGEKTENSSGTKFQGVFGEYVNGILNPNVINDANLLSWIAGGPRREVTSTYYDDAITGLPSGIVQNNLRKRVATVAFEDVGDTNPLTYQYATHYTYDIHGNVKTLWQQNPTLTGTIAGQALKRVDYEYDLISGKVNAVRYQDGQADAFYHFYEYDSDNRIGNFAHSDPFFSEYSDPSKFWMILG